jgi:hypothetical protein
MIPSRLPMDSIEIPAATFVGKAVVIGACVLVVVGILAWVVPKFKVFLNVVFGGTPRKPETRHIHLVLGFFVYALMFAPAAIATFIGVGVAAAGPTVISSEGVAGSDLACDSDLGVFPFSCAASLNLLVNSRQLLRWDEIDKVGCISRHDGTIRELYVKAGVRSIAIGSLAVHDLSRVRQLILAHAPRGVAEPCG